MRKKVNFGVVILHYMASEITIECVDKLLSNFENEDFHIVIVDNASDNNSGDVLEEKYQNNPKISVIKNDSNLGFAKGNNAGYDYLNENYDIDYIIVMNNDVIIEQLDFFKKIQEIDERTGFAVLGPDIFSFYQKYHQSPTREIPLTLDDAKKLKNAFLRIKRNYRYYYLKHLVKSFLKKDATVKNRNYLEEKTNVVLHGACYIFSKKFILNRPYLFNPKTFLYFEEEILHRECIEQSLKIVYSPEIKVNHYEDVSTNAKFKSKFKKYKMVNDEKIRSADVFIDLLVNENR